MNLLVIVISLVLSYNTCWAVEDSNDDCFYRGDMCHFSSVKKCFQHIYHNHCEAMYSSQLYGTNAVKFWANVKDPSDYASDLKLIVVQVINGTWKSVDDCCNMRINETCVLPPIRENNYEAVFAPLPDGDYCKYDIGRNPAMHPQWCVVDPKTPCLFIEDGEVVLNLTYDSISTVGWPAKFPTDYCFFYAPLQYGKRGIANYDGLTRVVEGITISDDGEIEGDEGEFKGKCVVVENQKSKFSMMEYLVSNNTKPGHTICVSIRIKIYDDRWYDRPVCVTIGVDYSINVVLVGVTIATAILVVISLILCVAVYKKYIKNFCPSYEKSVKEGIMRQMTNDDEKSFIGIRIDNATEKSKTDKDKIRHDSEKSDVSYTRRYVTYPDHRIHGSHIKTLETNVCQILPSYDASEESESGSTRSNSRAESEEIRNASEVEEMGNEMEATQFSSADGDYLPKDQCGSRASNDDSEESVSRFEGVKNRDPESVLNNNVVIEKDSDAYPADYVAKTENEVRNYDLDYVPKNTMSSLAMQVAS